MSQSPILADFGIARKRGTSLIGIRTMDPANMEYEIATEYEKDFALTAWDSMRGVRGLNGPGEAAARRIADLAGEEPEKLRSPIDLLGALPTGLPKGGLIFAHNFQMFMPPGTQETGLITQGIHNLRDEFKDSKRTFVHLGIDMYLPPEINQDVFMMDEPLPNDDQLRTIVMDTYAGAKFKEPDPKTLRQAIDALRGLSVYPAEQVTAMSLTDQGGLDLARLWSRKVMTIEQTPGLSIWRGGEAFDAIKGYNNAVNFVKMFFDGKRPPKGIMFIDELEKHLAGATGGDLSGVKQDMLGALLVWMQDRRARGLLFMGVPGSGKSAVAKAAGNYGKVPTISFDLAGMQEGIVGTSGRNIRNGLKVVDAVTSGDVLVIATTNSMDAIPPELRRRFKRGTFYFDLPDKSGKKAIWDMYLKRYNLNLKQPLPDDEGWTGAEIENCCEAADDFGSTVIEASNFVVPVARSAPRALEAMREMANDTFISASDGGIYRRPGKSPSKARREIDPSMN